MATQDLIEQLLELPNVEEQKRFLEEHTSVLDDQVADALKKQADQFLRADVQRSLETVDLMLYMAKLTGDPHHRALGLRAEGNVRCLGGLGDYQRACELYDEAASIYHESGWQVEQAKSLIGKLYALAFLGRYTEALQTGEWAGHILEQHGEWGRLAAVTLNLGLIRGRMGQDDDALALFDRAKRFYLRLGEQGKAKLAWADHNRAIVLRSLGRFEESLQASQGAWESLSRLGQKVEAARAQQNVALTYFVLGRYNEALELFDQVREVFVADGRQRDAILVELFISDCLLQLRRFADVLEKCQRIREHFTELGTRFEVAQALLNEAVAYAGLLRQDEALASLAEARRLFTAEGNDVWIACTDLEMAALLLRRDQHERSLAAAQACADAFKAHSQPVREAQAQLVAARAAVALNQHHRALQLVTSALDVAENQDVPSLTYQGHQLLGTLAAVEQDSQTALTEYDKAIQELERLRGRLMVEFRADFLQDKESMYQDAVRLCLDGGWVFQALEYVERSKSRALLDLLAYRLDLSVQARENADQPLVEELTQLRADRDRLYRRWAGGEESAEEGWAAADESRQQARQEVLALEAEITDLWHRLLIRNADYARDASLWHVRTEPIQPYLAPDTVLLEYYIAHQQLLVFVVTCNVVEFEFLPCNLDQVQRLIQFFWLNLKAVSRTVPCPDLGLATNAQGLLQELHGLLIAPLMDALSPYERWIVVPHGPLHYLPFHALHDGESFLIEQYEISYLPAASVLRYCREAQPADTGTLILGHSQGGRLPHTVDETEALAALLGEQAFLEDEATLARLRKAAPACRTIHLATHGEFRPDNPLFSGLALADGWLTTLDIFNLQLKASLVVLSACQTGRSVLGGGDELLGLMRALLYAGAASVMLSLWTVEDRSAAQFMESFYGKLAAGWSKGAALRHAQREFIHAHSDGKEGAAGRYAHPYFWAPFCLVGNDGAL